MEFKSFNDIANKYDIFLFDIWGVIVEGSTLYKPVIEKIKYLSSINKKYFF